MRICCTGGNGMVGRIIFTLSVLCILISFCFFSCNNNLVTALDGKIETEETIAPTPGGNGVITIDAIRAGAFDISWEKATDDVVSQEKIEYQVIYSLSNNIGTVTEAEENGTVAVPWQEDIDEGTISGLIILTTYYANIIIQDKAGNKAVYTPNSAKTENDTEDPVAGGNTGGEDRTLTLNNITDDSITVSWEKGSDDMTPLGNLAYKVVYSDQNNIYNVATVEANGEIGVDWTQDIDTYEVTGLLDNVNYYFNVLVRDEVYNMAAYLTENDTTDKYSRIYWVEQNNHLIRRADLNGDNIEDVYDTGVLTEPFAIALDPVARIIYYTDQLSDTVSRINFDGTNPVDLVDDDLTRPRGIALDLVNNNVYWTDFDNDKIYRAPLSIVDGDADVSPVVTIQTLPVDTEPNGIVVDPANNAIYWAEEGGTGRIQTADLDGNSTSTVLDGVTTHPLGLSIDTVSNLLYYTDRYNSAPYTPKVARMTTSGASHLEIINTSLTYPIGVAIDFVNPGNSYVYWTDAVTHYIYRAPSNTSGGNAASYIMSNIDTNTGLPTWIAIY